MATYRATLTEIEARMDELMMYHYGIYVHRLFATAQGWRLETDRGTFILTPLQKTDSTYWQLVHSMLLHLGARGVRHLPQLVPTVHGKLTFSGFRSRYVLWTHIDNEKCDWHHLATWGAIGKTLALIHRASSDFPLEETHRRFMAAGRWSALWERNLALLDTVRSACFLSSDPRPIDRTWLNIHTYVTTWIETALRYLEHLGGDQEVWAKRNNGIVGQHDLQRHSWGLHRSGHPTLLNWTQTVLDVRVRDLAQMAHLAYADKTTYRARIQLLLTGYDAVHPLSEAEWAMLYARMLFPERLVKVARDIYKTQTVPPDEAEAALQRAIAAQQRHEHHLRLIPRLIRDIAQVSIPEVPWISRA